MNTNNQTLPRFEDKKQLRRYIREQKRSRDERQLQQLSAAIMDRLLAHPRVVAAGTVLMYYSLPDEVCTHEAIDRMVAAGKRVLLPAVVSDTEMELRCYEGPADLTDGPFNIKEPTGQPFQDYAAIETAVVPGMAFDAGLNRLGRGKGYYDRFLRRIPQAYKLGVCFPFQLLPHIPTDPTDVRMDEVL